MKEQNTKSSTKNQPKTQPTNDKPISTTKRPYTKRTPKPAVAQPTTPTALQTISNATKIPEYAPANVKKLMAKLDMNEKAFALVMNVSPMTVRLWTSGAAKPCGLSRRLMQIFDASPNLAVEIVASQEG